MTTLPGRPAKPIVLELDLTAPLVEHEPDDPLARLRLRGRPRLGAVLRALRGARDDDRVVALVARVGAAAMTLAQAQELRDAVRAFGAAGKRTVAWAETFGDSGNGTIPYFLATGFGEVWLQPSAELDLLGVAAEVQFLRGALDKLRVEPLLDRRHEYKNAADRLLATGFTDAHREASERLVDSAWEQVSAAIALARDLSAAEVEDAVRAAPLFAADAHRRRLVDRLGYRDEVYAGVGATPGSDDVTLLYAERWTPPGGVAARLARQVRDKRRPGVALVEAAGGIVSGRSRRSPLQGPLVGSDTVCAALRAAARDEHVRAVVFRVDSPGGSAVASDTIWRAVECVRAAGKPVVVSMASLAGSGGYYVACGADVVVAHPGTLTGSIGVLGGKLDTSGLAEWLGVHVDGVQRGERARMFSSHRGFDADEWERLQAMLDHVYAEFTGKVALGRRMSPAAVHEVARGRVWTGADALALGLVDALGGLADATDLARERAGLPPGAPLRPALEVPALARLRPPRSSEDPRAAAVAVEPGGALAAAWLPGWGAFAPVAATLGLSAYGPLTMPHVTLR